MTSPCRTLRWAGISVVSAPRKNTCPPAGRTSPVAPRSSEDFPAPLLPMTATSWPGFTLSEMSRTATAAP